MTGNETQKIIAGVHRLWPHSNLGDNPAEVVATWSLMLAEADYADVDRTVRSLAATGREHAPPVGVIVASLAGRAADAPDFDQVAAEIVRAIQVYRPPGDVAARDPYACPPATYWSHPAIGAYVSSAVWKDWQTARDGDGTFRAQARDHYNAHRNRARRAAQLRAVGAPVPTHLEPAQTGPRRLDALRHLPAPPPAMEALDHQEPAA